MVTQKFQTSELKQMNLLTIQEVADLAKVSAKTIYRWISDNKIPAIRLGTRTYLIPEKAIHIEVAWGPWGEFACPSPSVNSAVS